MAVLKEQVKLAIVQALACYDTPTQVAALIKEEFGLEISRQQAATYDPTKACGRNLSAKLKAVFHASREEFIRQAADIPIAQLSYRLRVLQRELERAQARGNGAMVSQLLEQAAKEVGGVFTNRRELTGAGGGPIAQQTTNVTPEQLAEAVRSVRSEF